MNFANLIVSSCIMGVQFIWMILASCCFCRYRKTDCNKVHAVFYSSYFLAMAIAMVVLSSIELAGLKSRSDPLIDWSNYADCVDSYMQINDYQAGQISEAHSAGVAMLVLSLIILLIHTHGFILHIKQCCKRYSRQCCCCCH